MIFSRTTLFGAATIAVAVLFLSPADARASGLFDSLPDAESAAFAAAPPSPDTVRDRLVRLDLGYMEENLVPADADTAHDRLKQLPDAPVRVELFDDIAATLVRTDVDKAFGRQGGYVWSGNVREDEIGYALLVISGGQMTGQIMTDHRLFTISPVEGGVHRIAEVDDSKSPGGCIEIPAPVTSDSATVDAAEAASPEGKTIITVLVAYTPAANRAVPDIVKTANQAIGLANTSLKNAGVQAKFKLVGTKKVKKYKEASFAKDAKRLQAGKGSFRPIHRFRNKKKADLVSMLRKTDKTGKTCGAGFTNVPLSVANAPYGFSVVGIGCVPRNSVAHEMGHNAGLYHDRYSHVSEGYPVPGSTVYNFGHVNHTDEIRTVMAYDAACVASGYNCDRVPAFSSSTKKYNGSVIGLPSGNADAADAARTLNVTKGIVWLFR